MNPTEVMHRPQQINGIRDRLFGASQAMGTAHQYSEAHTECAVKALDESP
jgi:hypothetical protein